MSGYPAELLIQAAGEQLATSFEEIKWASACCKRFEADVALRAISAVEDLVSSARDQLQRAVKNQES